MMRQMLSWVIVPEAGIATIEAASGEAMHGAVAPHPDDLEFVVECVCAHKSTSPTLYEAIRRHGRHLAADGEPLHTRALIHGSGHVVCLCGLHFGTDDQYEAHLAERAPLVRVLGFVYMARFVECECGAVSEGETIGEVIAAHGDHLATDHGGPRHAQALVGCAGRGYCLCGFYHHTTQQMSEHLADVG